MKERPILFSAPMVRAILAGDKTQTRRVVKPQPHYDRQFSNDGMVLHNKKGDQTTSIHTPLIACHCPYGMPGDRLWVRETWMDLSETGIEPITGSRSRYAYRADTPAGSYGDETRKEYGLKWRPSIFMPRSACRILLEVVSVRVERLNDISEVDSLAEGSREWASEQDTPVRDIPAGETHLVYRQLWESINGAGSWDADPWVWVVEFKQIESQKGMK